MDGTLNNNGEDCCGYCLEKVEYMVDPRELPCSHVFCLPCLQADFLKHQILECITCKKKHGEVQVDDLIKVEKLILSDDTEEDQPLVFCDICKAEESAFTYCIDCGKKMCETHDEYHDEYQNSFSKIKHRKIGAEEYIASPDRYTVSLCPKHEEEQLVRVCKHCLKTFCYSCETVKKCSAVKGDMHEIEDIEELSQKFKVDLNKRLNSLSTRLTEAYTLEKKSLGRMEDVEVKVEHMNNEVDRVVKEQISILHNKAKSLKLAIELYRSENAVTVNDFVGDLKKKKKHLGNLWKSTNQMLTKKHDTEIIKQYTVTSAEIMKVVESELGYCHMPFGRMLVRTGEHRDIEVQLRESIPFSIDLKFKEKKGTSAHCSCICLTEARNLLCGREEAVLILDREDLNPISSFKTTNVNGVARHDQGYLALHWENGKNYIILYSPELVFMKLFGEFYRPTDKYSQMTATRTQVIAMDPDEKQLNVYNERGVFQFHAKLPNTKRPWGVHMLLDGCVLITDFVGGCLRKYRLKAGECEPVWCCRGLLTPVGIASDDADTIFVSSFSAKKIYIISFEGKILKELTHPELQNIKEIYDITVDREMISLACGNNGVLQFQMVYDAIVK